MTNPPANDILPHLFRTEFRKIVAMLCQSYGFEHLGAAEDIAGETFLTAAESWPYKGIPVHPAAWLYGVAKNKAKNQLTRKKIFDQKIAPLISDNTPSTVPEPEWTETAINDSQLQMMFAICDPVIPEESQICLALRVLCGFGIEEIANALLTGKDTINKRLSRAKAKLRECKAALAFPGDDQLEKRLKNVLLCLYLLYNEGYYSESHHSTLRKDLCDEAMHLVRMLIACDRTNRPETNALYALMCFHSSRFAARKAANGELILYDDQDEKLWDQKLISEGIWHLKNASVGNTLSKYHIEASIGYWYTIKEDTAEKWDSILLLHNPLLQLSYSPIAALNRTYAFSRVHGAEKAITEALKLKLDGNAYYFILLGELHRQSDPARARDYFSKALDLLHTEAERDQINRKIHALPR